MRRSRVRKRDAPSYFKAVEALSGVRTEAQCFDVLLPAIFEVFEASDSQNEQKSQNSQKTSPGKRVSREMQRYQERLRSTSAELARFQSPPSSSTTRISNDPRLISPLKWRTQHMFTLGSASEHLSPERTLPRDTSAARVSPIVQLDPQKNVGYIYDIPREDLDFLDGTPEPVQGSENAQKRADGA